MLLAEFLAVVVGLLDYYVGYEIDVTAFYLLPVFWASWAVGRKEGLIVATTCAVIIAGEGLVSRRAGLSVLIIFWNVLMMFICFVGAVYALTAARDAYKSLAQAEASLRDTNEHLEETVQRRTAALKSEIAERQRQEQARLQAERLLERQEKLATLGTLTAGIAHEIRNPLTSLKARLYTLEKHLHDVPAARRDTDIIGAEISRLERIVRDALSFARPAEPKLEPVAADTLLGEVHGLMATSLESRAVQLAVEAAPGLIVRADSGHLKQVLINLVRNAADAISGEGIVTLHACRGRAVLEDCETEVVRLEVSDTGQGIAPEVEKRLFDPFFSTKETGTGLGLPIAARMIEKNGGKIEYQTRIGHGTTFAVVLPREMRDSCTQG
jgi:signal transduction histidine kinase